MTCRNCYTGLIIDPGVKADGIYYCDLRLQLLPVIMSSLWRVHFQQGSASVQGTLDFRDQYFTR